MEKVFTVTLQGGKTTDVFFADSIKDLSSKLSSYGLNALWVFDTNTAPLFKNLPPNRIVLESGEKLLSSNVVLQFLQIYLCRLFVIPFLFNVELPHLGHVK